MVCVHRTAAVCVHRTAVLCVHRTAVVCIHRTAVVCVHRTPDVKNDIFLIKLELIIQILIVNNNILILD